MLRRPELHGQPSKDQYQKQLPTHMQDAKIDHPFRRTAETGKQKNENSLVRTTTAGSPTRRDHNPLGERPNHLLKNKPMRVYILWSPPTDHNYHFGQESHLQSSQSSTLVWHHKEQRSQFSSCWSGKSRYLVPPQRLFSPSHSLPKSLFSQRKPPGNPRRK